MPSYVVYRVRMKLGSGFNLGSQVWGRAKQKPAFGITADGDLRLRSSFPAEGSGS
jgi:FixJ family two-component response regulator